MLNNPHTMSLLSNSGAFDHTGWSSSAAEVVSVDSELSILLITFSGIFSQAYGMAERTVGWSTTLVRTEDI